MSEQLIITNYKDYIVSLHYDDLELLQINTSNCNDESILGNIYVGRVANIVKNIEAAFIEISDGLMCYYSINKISNRIFLNPKKNDTIVVGDLILVQVIKEAVNAKAPVVTDILNITGKYAVLTHGKQSLSVSNKITDKEKIASYKNILKKYKNDTYGFIIRTNAQNASVEEIDSEVNTLIRRYEKIISDSKHLVCFSMVYKAPKPYICDIRDSFSKNISSIITDDNIIYDNIENYLKEYQKDELNKLTLYNDTDISLNALYSINNSINNALKEKIWLKSGGTIVIQPTEALVAIDVNTGKAISGKSNAQNTFLKINIEAAKEIAKQLRLRNLGGIIIVDFIDLQKEEDKKILLEEFDKVLRKDPIKTTLIDMTGLNLVELTRKKVRKPLYQQLFTHHNTEM